MQPLIFLDANVPIYAAGTPHPLKQPCAAILLHAAQQPQGYVTDAEVLQELVHYYLSRGRWALGRGVVQRFAVLMQDRVEPVYAADVREAAMLADQYTALSARDLLHIGVMTRLGITNILSADRGFDAVGSLTRYDPLAYSP